MRRLFFFFALFFSFFFCGGRGAYADQAVDVAVIRQRVQDILNFLTNVKFENWMNNLPDINNGIASFYSDFLLFWEWVDEYVSSGGFPVSDEQVLSKLGDLSQIIDYIWSDTTQLYSELTWHGSMMSEITAVLTSVYNDALETINTSPNWDALAGYFSDLQVSLVDPGMVGSLIGESIVERLKDLHFQVDVVGDVSIDNLDDMADALGNVNFSYFDDWRNYSLDLFGRTFDRTLKYWEWGSSNLGEGSIKDVSQNSASINGDWFDAILQILFYGAENQEQQHRTLLEVLNSLQSTNAAEVAVSSQNRLDSLGNDVSSFESAMAIDGNSQISSLTDESKYGVVKDYRKFGNLSPMFATSGLGSFLRIHLGDTVDSQGAALELSGDLSLSEMSDFVQAARKGTSIMWWLFTFLFSAVALFRIFALFRYVNDNFFRVAIGFGR